MRTKTTRPALPVLHVGLAWMTGNIAMRTSTAAAAPPGFLDAAICRPA